MAKKRPAKPGYSVDPARVATQEGFVLDARGLMPLDEARRHVQRASTFERAGGEALWMALLSLESADEFVREATRIQWSHHPFLFGWDNEDAVTRYGAGALPWLEAMLDQAGGIITTVPAQRFYFVGTGLLAIGPEALQAILRAKRQDDADPDGLGFLSDWLRRHGESAWAALARDAEGGSPTSRRAVEALARRSPRSAKQALGKALGKDAAARLLSASPGLEAGVILRVLDAAASASIGERLPWPAIRASAGHFEYHAMRLIGVRAEKGDDWGILIEVAQGDLCDPQTEWPAVVQQYGYGSRVTAGGRYLTDSRPLGVRVAGSAIAAPVEKRLDAALASALDLRPGRSITGCVESWLDVLAIRAVLALDRRAIFPDPAEVVGLLQIKKPRIVVVADAFAHVDGPAHGREATLPSQSVAYRTLADAIVAQNGALFDAGEANTDWRLYADHEQDFAW